MLIRSCSRCGVEKPLDAAHFYRDKTCVAGLETVCKPCRYEQKKAAQANPKPKRKVEYDWSFLDDERVMAAVETAVRRALRKFPSWVMQEDDIRSDCLEWTARNGDKVAEFMADETRNVQVFSVKIYTGAVRKKMIRRAEIGAYEESFEYTSGDEARNDRERHR